VPARGKQQPLLQRAPSVQLAWHRWSDASQVAPLAVGMLGPLWQQSALTVQVPPGGLHVVEAVPAEPPFGGFGGPPAVPVAPPDDLPLLPPAPLPPVPLESAQQ
jgi:hypothetical protein